MTIRNTKGDAMNNEDLRSTADTEGATTVMADVDTDDSDASDVLEVIGRNGAPETAPEEAAPAKMRTSQGASPFLLESLYFRSFGERALLTRAEEIALAKRVDEGTRRIRVAL